jgi:phage gpG-like protein
MSAPNINKEVKKAVNALLHLQRRVLPVKVGTTAVNMFKDNFTEGGFFGQTWQEPIRRKLSFNGARGQYGTLQSRSSHLMRSFEKDIKTPGRVVIRNPVEYAAIHNDGGTITVTAKMKRYFMAKFIETKGSMSMTKKGKLGKNKRNQGLSREAQFYLAMAHKQEGSQIRMPKRRFMGNHPVLTKKISDIIYNELKKFIEDYGRNIGTAR